MMIFGMEDQRERNRDEDVLHSDACATSIPEYGFVQRGKLSCCRGLGKNGDVSAFGLKEEEIRYICDAIREIKKQRE